MNPLWRVVRRLFGRPKGRHAAGASPPPEPPTPTPPPTVEAPEPAVAPRATSQSLAPLAPQLPVAGLQALGRVRLIFGDGSIASLPAGSLDERRARYLAENVLAATGRH